MSFDTKQDLFGKEHTVTAIMERDALAASLVNSLQNMTLEQIVSLITNPVEAAVEYGRLLHGDRKVGQQISLLFNPHRLNIKTKSSKQSIFQATRDDSWVSGLARSMLWMQQHKKSSQTRLFDLAMQLGVNGVQYVNEFPPCVMREMCKRYGLGPDSRVLDPCAGWGGRMIGASAVVNRYVAFEPSTLTHTGLKRLKAFIRTMRPTFRAAIYCLPFEDADLSDETPFDFACTSPPYYNTEEYSAEETNSLNRYKSFEEWVIGFYVPMIAKTLDALKPGAAFVLNIGSRVYPLAATLKEHFNATCKIRRVDGEINNGGGLRRNNEDGESFYELRRR